MEALFPGKSEMDQLNKIFKELGTPSDRLWPGYSKLPMVQKIPFSHYPVNNLRQRFSLSLTDLGIELLNKYVKLENNIILFGYYFFWVLKKLYLFQISNVRSTTANNSRRCTKRRLL